MAIHGKNQAHARLRRAFGNDDPARGPRVSGRRPVIEKALAAAEAKMDAKFGDDTPRPPAQGRSALRPTTIYQHGRAAVAQGKPLAANPFIGSDAERWRQGYRAGLAAPGADAPLPVSVRIATPKRRGRMGSEGRRAREAGR